MLSVNGWDEGQNNESYKMKMECTSEMPFILLSCDHAAVFLQIEGHARTPTETGGENYKPPGSPITQLVKSPERV